MAWTGAKMDLRQPEIPDDADYPNTREVPALIVNQWLPEWDEVKWNPEHYQAEPPHHFYMLSLPAGELKRLSKVYRRKAKPGESRATDVNAQRYHDASRSEEISEFVRYGFPWSDLNEAKRRSGDFADLRKPGWLPTAIVVNVLKIGDPRDDGKLQPEHEISIVDNHKTAAFQLPATYPDPQDVAPIEIIDGQHRLWAFDDEEAMDYDLPVVAFHGLDRSWQAYLFWTINIKPKRINASLAFDLYPLLRTETWLDKFYGHSIYRETRAQELVQALWSHEGSPWQNRINMLGEPGQRRKTVSQAAWVRSLTASFVKAWTESGSSIGGLFGARIGKDEIILGWGKYQQAAVLIYAWQALATNVQESDYVWAKALRHTIKRTSSAVNLEFQHEYELDQAFAGEYSLLNTDQGVRAALHVFNDLLFLSSDRLALQHWQISFESVDDYGAVDEALKSLDMNTPISSFIQEIATGLASFDWRTAAFPGFVNDIEVRERKSAYRGSGGYKILRSHLLQWLIDQRLDVSVIAAEAQQRLGY